MAVDRGKSHQGSVRKDPNMISRILNQRSGENCSPVELAQWFKHVVREKIAKTYPIKNEVDHK